MVEYDYIFLVYLFIDLPRSFKITVQSFEELVIVYTKTVRFRFCYPFSIVSKINSEFL